MATAWSARQSVSDALIASVPSLQQTKSGLRPASQSRSGLPLQPTDLPLLLTEQIAHLRPFPIVFAWEIARCIQEGRHAVRPNASHMEVEEGQGVPVRAPSA